MSEKKKLSYPGNFFMDLYGKESSDIEFADFLIEQIIVSDFRWMTKNRYEQRFDIYDIIVEYYKEKKPASKIAEKQGVSYSVINTHRHWGLFYIRSFVNRNIRPAIHPLNYIAPSYSPVTFSEYNDIKEIVRHQVIK